ncbi:glycosyltransferase [Halocalculus aciditolerans]|nr:glycosyltransferase [Halocalculus aciditolerans]
MLISFGVKDENIKRVEIVNPEYTSRFEREPHITNNESGEYYRCIYVGALEPHKNVHSLVKALQLVPSGEIKLDIVGNGSERERLQDLVERRDLTDTVDFHGELDHRTVLKMIRDSNLLIHPSKRETGPRTVQEAQQIGTPVIATPVGKTPELISHMKNGLLTRDDPENIAENINYALNNQREMREMAIEGQKSFSPAEWDKTVKTINKLVN